MIGNSSHTNARSLLRSWKHMTISKLTSTIVIFFNCFDWNHCYSLYIDKVMWLETVTVTAICWFFQATSPNEILLAQIKMVVSDWEWILVLFFSCHVIIQMINKHKAISWCFNLSHNEKSNAKTVFIVVNERISIGTLFLTFGNCYRFVITRWSFDKICQASEIITIRTLLYFTQNIAIA